MPNSRPVHDSHSVNIVSDDGNDDDLNKTAQFPGQLSLENLRAMRATENAKKEARNQAPLTKEFKTTPNQRRTSPGCMGTVYMGNRRWESSSRNTETQRQKEDLFTISHSVLCPYTKELN